MLYKYFNITNKFKTQVEVQGTKKLGSVKGVQVLDVKELKEIEGGFKIKIFGYTLLERDGRRDKGERWKWDWQDEW